MKMKIARIEDQGDRVLYYSQDETYHVIGSVHTANRPKVGETIVYEPCGCNFGFINPLPGACDCGRREFLRECRELIES